MLLQTFSAGHCKALIQDWSNKLLERNRRRQSYDSRTSLLQTFWDPEFLATFCCNIEASEVKNVLA